MKGCWRTLVERAKSGSDSAIEELIVRYKDVVIHATSGIYPPPHLSRRDLTQEIWIRVVLKLHQFKHLQSPTDAAFRQWLRTTARRVSLAIVRIKNVSCDANIDAGCLPGDPESPSSRLKRIEMQQIVADALLELDDPIHFDVIWMRHVDCMTLNEVAAKCSLSVHQVRHVLKVEGAKLKRRLDGLL